ncbi:Lrp/AsnC family transcriptional regulator [Rhodobacter capsulatus]|uniref:Lrp/AsnC family transcriptional regulator n=2 Tax=Rhodobacter capsulatus TaxID=1061 RepID=A0A4U1JTF1_RHOCA|nr:Lrp/AsnC family transcriptional regulator [Rhodobacter capsulatus]
MIRQMTHQSGQIGIMDEIDRKICALLSEDARQSMAQLGVRVGLSPSAVNDRLRRLIERGVLRRTRADVDPEAVGLPVAAFVWIALAEGIDETAFRAAIADNTAVTACHHVTGGWSYLVQIRVASLVAVEDFLVALKRAGWIARTETMLALSTVVEPPFRYRR